MGQIIREEQVMSNIKHQKSRGIWSQKINESSIGGLEKAVGQFLNQALTVFQRQRDSFLNAELSKRGLAVLKAE